MQQRRGTQAEWNDPVIASTVKLAPGEVGLETDTGRFKIGNGDTVWQNLPYYLPDNNPTGITARQGKNNHDIYAKLSPLAESYSQTFTGTQVMVPQAANRTPLVVSGLAGQSTFLQIWRNNTGTTLASIDHAGKITATGGGSFGGEVNVNSNRITNVGTPTSDSDAVNKVYVDDAIAGLAWKEAVNLIAHGTGANIALTGSTNTLVIDGHSALDSTDSGYRILLTAQTTASQNGIYVYNDNGTTYTLTRSSDADTYQELVGASVYVQEGTLYGTSSWVQSNHYLSSFSGQSWVQFSGAALITAGTGMTKDGNKLDVVGTTDRITANADSIDIASTYVGQTSITTLGTVTTGTWNATTVAANKGGTGQTSYTVGDILYADTVSSLAKLSAGTTGYTVISQGSGVVPQYGQLDTAGIKNDAVTYDKIQNVGAQYRVLGRVSSGAGNTEEVTPDGLMEIINQGTTGIAFSLLPVGTTSTTVAQGNHTHTLSQLTDVTITNDPVLGTPKDRQVIKYKGAPINKWVNELPSGGISIGATPPVDAAAGDAWFDSGDGSLYVYYDDGVDNDGAGPGISAQWVQVKANSALEGSILTRVSALEARSTDIEAANAVRVANATERNSVYPAPVQGNTVFRADLGYEEKYYAAYNATTNPDGTRGTAGWYRYNGGAPISYNYLLNASMDIWQRGTSFANFTTTRYTADRWYVKPLLGAEVGITRLSGLTAAGTSPGEGIDNALSFSVNTAGGANVIQIIENLNCEALTGKTITASAYVRSLDIANTMGITIQSSTTIDAGDGATWTTVATATFSVPQSTSWTKVVATGVVPSNAGTVRVVVDMGTLNKSSVYQLTGVQLEEGPVDTTFHRNQPNIQAELAACQRYYQVVRSGGNFSGNGEEVIGMAMAYSATAMYTTVNLLTEMRIAPQITASNGSNHFMFEAQNGSDFMDTLNATLFVTKRSFGIGSTNQFGGFTAGTAGWLRTNNAAALITASAEL
jgi:hypothetical protein